MCSAEAVDPQPNHEAKAQQAQALQSGEALSGGLQTQ